MPKRSNDFQELIAAVYEQITPDGGKVTESGMVFDKDAKDCGKWTFLLNIDMHIMILNL